MQNVHVSPSRIRVLVAHPNPVLAAGLESILTREPDVDVIACEDPGTAPSREQLESASIVITECDTGMGVVWHRPQSCRVVIVTADDSEISIRRAMERGASAYLLLAASREHIVRAIRRVHVGKTELDPSVSSKIAVSVTSPTLSPREIEVLWHLMAGCSNKEIARRLMRSVATAKSHVKAILIKLGASSRTEAAAIARKRGLIPARAPTHSEGVFPSRMKESAPC